MELLVKSALVLSSFSWSFAVYSVSHGHYWHFTVNLLFYTNFNARSVIRCGWGVEFQSALLLLFSGLFIPSSCALKVKLPFIKPPCPYLSDPPPPQPPPHPHPSFQCARGALCLIAGRAMSLSPGTSSGHRDTALRRFWRVGSLIKL